MHKWRLWTSKTFLLLAAFLAIGGIAYGTGSAYAVTSASPHYQVTETQFNAGASQQSCSGQYCAKASIGDTAVGSANSQTLTAQFGSITKSDPLLEVIVDPGQSNLGNLSTDSTATKTMTVKVRNYLSGGYTLQIIGDPPKYSGHPLSTNSTPTASLPGTEQFGINVTGNTVPNIGKDAEQVPSDSLSFGVVDTKYRQANKFLFTSGDVVAKSSTSSGQTNYTISMIVNISSATPAGHYSADFSAVVVPAY